MQQRITGPLLHLLSLFLFVLSAGLSGQTSNPDSSKNTSPDQQPPLFRANTRLVIVDVVVTNHNQPVTGLKPENFTLFEDGKQQKLAAVEPHIAKERKPLDPPIQMPPHQFTNFPVQENSGPVNIILFDLLNTLPMEQVYAKKQMVQFLKELPSGQRLALFVLGTRLRMIQGFTGNSDTLIKAAEAVQANRSLLVTSEEERQTDEWVNSVALGGDRSDPGGASGRILAALSDQAKMQENQRAEGTLNALSVLAGSVSAYPGRKNVMWLSTNFPFRFGPQDDQKIHEQRRFLNPFQQVSAMLAAAQIAIYPIDIGGLSTDGLGSSSGAGLPGTSIVNRQVTQRWDTHEAMTNIAKETGGRAFYGTNDFKDMMQRSLEQGENYYTLAYVPENHDWNGKYRKIEVKVAHDDVKLEYRRGYYAVAETEIKGDDAIRLLTAAIQPSVPETTMLIMKVQVLPPDHDHKNVTIDYAIAPGDISFKDGDDHLKHGHLDFMASAWSKENKEVAHVITPIDFHMRKEVYDQIQQTGVPAHQELELKPGTYLLRVGVMDRQTQKIGHSKCSSDCG
jgi:VWFA-related protein